jgi:hypothetical protein
MTSHPTISAADFRKMQEQPLAHKYHAKAVWVDGIRFPSKREAKRWMELKTLAELGLIKHLRRQVPFRLHVNGKLITTYRADFTYEGESGAFVVEDAKGVRTPEYQLKKKMMAAEHGIEIREV